MSAFGPKPTLPEQGRMSASRGKADVTPNGALLGRYTNWAYRAIDWARTGEGASSLNCALMLAAKRLPRGPSEGHDPVLSFVHSGTPKPAGEDEKERTFVLYPEIQGRYLTRRCPLPTVKPTWRGRNAMSANDPKRTWWDRSFDHFVGGLQIRTGAVRPRSSRSPWRSV